MSIVELKDKKSPKKRMKKATLELALVGLFAALLEGAKLALSFLPNIELVSLLLAVFGFVFGRLGIFASLIFCAIEPLIWGFGTWVVSYFLYWPLIPAFFLFLSVLLKRRACPSSLGKRLSFRRSFTSSLLPAIAISLFTLYFGALTSLVDVGLFTGSFDNFWYRFGILYLRGVPFFITHIISNFLVFLFLFNPLAMTLEKIKKGLHF